MNLNLHPMSRFTLPASRATGLVALLAALSSTGAGALELDYQHQYVDKDREHKDKFMIIEDLPHGFGMAFEAVTETAETHDGQPGKAYSRLTKDALKAKLKYSHKLTKTLKIKPKFTFSKGEDKKSYKTAVKFPYELTNRLSVSPGYYHKVTTYDEQGKRNKNDDSWQLGAKYKFERFSVGVAHKEVYSNELLFDNKKRNYNNKALLEFKATPHFTPYLEVADVEVDEETNERQVRYRVGVRYEF